MTDTRTTVVVITHNRRPELLRTLDRLAELPERPEVIVTDNASTDGTASAVARHHPRVRLLRPGRNLGAVGRNLAVRHVRTPTSPSATTTPGGRRAPWPGPPTCSTAIRRSGRSPPASSSNRTAPRTHRRGAARLARAPPGLAPGPALGSFLAAATVLRTDAFRAAGGFHPGCGWAARRNCSPPTWRRTAGG